MWWQVKACKMSDLEHGAFWCWVSDMKVLDAQRAMMTEAARKAALEARGKRGSGRKGRSTKKSNDTAVKEECLEGHWKEDASEGVGRRGGNESAGDRESPEFSGTKFGNELIAIENVIYGVLVVLCACPLVFCPLVCLYSCVRVLLCACPLMRLLVTLCLLQIERRIVVTFFA